MSARRTASEGASWVGRISCAGGVFGAMAKVGVAEAETAVAEAGTDGVGAVVIDEVVPLEAASFRSIAEVSCVGAESLGRLRGREELSIHGVPNVPGRGERPSATS